MRPGPVRGLLIGVSLVLYCFAAWLLLWSITVAQVNFVACPAGYSIWADQTGCRCPVFLELASIAAFAGAVVVTVVVFCSRRELPSDTR